VVFSHVVRAYAFHTHAILQTREHSPTVLGKNNLVETGLIGRELFNGITHVIT